MYTKSVQEMTLHKNNKQLINYYVKTFCQYYDIPNTKCHHNRENYNNIFVKKYAKRLLQRRTIAQSKNYARAFDISL